MKNLLVVLVLLIGTLTSFGSNDFATSGGGIFTIIVSIFFLIVNIIFLFRGIKFFNRYLSLNEPNLYFCLDNSDSKKRSYICYLDEIRNDDYYIRYDRSQENFSTNKKGYYEETVMEVFDTKQEALDYLWGIIEGTEK